MKKKKIDIRQSVIVLIRILFFLFFPAVFSTAFAGIKYVASQIGSGRAIEVTAFVVTLLGVVGFTIVFGRFFCGFACSFGSYGDFIYELSVRFRKKLKKRVLRFPEKLSEGLRYVKYLVLLAIILICIAGKSSWIQNISPWDVFSRLQARTVPKAGVGVLIFIGITIGMFFEKRFFCRFLCPMGAVFSLLPVLPVSSVKRNRENCIKGCKACKMKCPASISIASSEDGDSPAMGECFSCGKCMETCPKGNVHTSILTGKKNVFVWNLVRGVILFAVMYFCL